MDSLPSVDSSVYYQRISQHRSGQEEKQGPSDREERQRQQADLHQEEKEATGSR